MDNRETLNHPAYGVVSISRVNGTDMTMYGSSVPVDNAIAITVRKSQLERDVVNDHYCADDILLRFEFTPIQWAEFVSQVSTKIPCTITNVNGKYIERLKPIATRQTKLRQYLANDMQGIFSKLETLQTTINDIAMPKAAKIQLARLVDNVKCDYAQNMPYYMQLYQEAMDDISLETKSKFDCWLTGKIHDLGLEALSKDLLKLTGDISDGKDVLKLNSEVL